MIIFDADDPRVLDGTYDREGYTPKERRALARKRETPREGPQQTYIDRHPERVKTSKRESARRRRAANIDLARAIGRFRARLWNARHPEQHRANVQAFKDAARAKDPAAFKMRRRAEASLRRARKREASIGPAINYQRIRARDRMRCHICRRRVRLTALHFDHVIPLAKGGTHTEANIAVSHARCNLHKHTRVTTLF